MEDLAREILKLEPGDVIDTSLVKEFMEGLKEIKRFSRAASSGRYTLAVRRKKLAGRMMKVICLESNPNKSIPVTLKSLRDKKPQNHRQEVLNAMRSMVKYQIYNHRRQHRLALDKAIRRGDKESFEKLSKCKYSGQSLKDIETHVHHADKPFIQLAEEWLETQQINVDKVKLTGRSPRKKFHDDSLVDSWCRFHAENAVLEIISASENLRMGAGSYRSKAS